VRLTTHSCSTPDALNPGQATKYSTPSSSSPSSSSNVFRSSETYQIPDVQRHSSHSPFLEPPTFDDIIGEELTRINDPILYHTPAENSVEISEFNVTGDGQLVQLGSDLAGDIDQGLGYLGEVEEDGSLSDQEDLVGDWEFDASDPWTGEDTQRLEQAASTQSV
jgi:hypothetical protein